MTLTVAVIDFARALRRAGLAIGPGESVDAVRALAAVGVASRDDAYSALHAVLVHRREDFATFDAAFRQFWRAPAAADGGPPPVALGLRRPVRPAARRAREAMAPEAAVEEPGDSSPRPDAWLSASAQEALKSRDFEQLSLAELNEAMALLKRLRPLEAAWPIRRSRPDRRGDRLDRRASWRASARTGFDGLALCYARPQQLPPPLVVLADISGSMDRYARMFLRFLHTLMRSRRGVHVFLFGTRLTNVTRHLQQPDADAALAAVAAAVPDWAGGTRIGAALAAFNRDWGRRVLARDAHVLLLTDGLDRDGGRGLACEIERLRLSCRRLTWLNPLLRYAEFAPLAGGAKVLIGAVDDLLPAHNISALEALAAALAGRPRRRQRRNVSRPQTTLGTA